MIKTGKWYIDERTDALARVHLTRREDLRLTSASEGPIDYWVSLTGKGTGPSLRKFGVILKGVVRPLTAEQANEDVRPVLRDLAAEGEYPCPVCLFLFTMEDNRGFYTWVAEPLVREGQPLLRVREDPDCAPLDRPALDEIAAGVDAWYDAFFASVNTGPVSGSSAG